MTTERLTFTGAFGDRLAARLEMPDGEPVAYALFAHCFTCSKDLKAARWLSEALAERSIAVLRFDFTGIGESEGDFSNTNFSSNLDDLLAAAEMLRRDRLPPRLLIGHSLGGAAVIAAAARIPEAAAVVTIAAPSDTTHFRDTLLRTAPELTSRGVAEITLGGRRFTIRRQLLEDLEEHAMEKHLAALGRPLLVCHSPADRTVPVEEGLRIFSRAGQPKSFLSLDGADHVLLADEDDARWIGRVVAAWAARYLNR